MLKRDQLDAIAWRTLDEHVPPGPRPGGLRGGSVQNYRELWEQAQAMGFEHAWSNLLHGFFGWKNADTFAAPPPQGLGPEWCATLAGAAEYRCHRYGLSVPAWVEEPRYFLTGRWEFVPLVDIWVPWPWPEVEGDKRWEQTPEEFRRRGLCFLSTKLNRALALLAVNRCKRKAPTSGNFHLVDG
jgi:hypothetical protein